MHNLLGEIRLERQFARIRTYNSAVSAAQVVTVDAPFFLQGTTTAAVVAGQTATYSLGLGSVGTFSGTVTLACSGAPAGTTCTISPGSVAVPSTSGSTPVTVTVATTTSASQHKLPFRGLPIVFAAMFAIALSRKNNRKQYRYVAMVVLLAFGITSCGGGGGSNSGFVPTPTPTPIATPTPSPTPVNQATLVVTATSGSFVTTTNLTLTITH